MHRGPNDRLEALWDDEVNFAPRFSEAPVVAVLDRNRIPREHGDLQECADEDEAVWVVFGWALLQPTPTIGDYYHTSLSQSRSNLNDHSKSGILLPRRLYYTIVGFCHIFATSYVLTFLLLSAGPPGPLLRPH